MKSALFSSKYQFTHLRGSLALGFALYLPNLTVLHPSVVGARLRLPKVRDLEYPRAHHAKSACQHNFLRPDVGTTTRAERVISVARQHPTP